MDNLRWILIIAGVAILVLLYFSGRSRNAVAERSPSAARPKDNDPLLRDDVPGPHNDFEVEDPEDLMRPGTVATGPGMHDPMSRTAAAMPTEPADYPLDYDLEPERTSGVALGLTGFSQKLEQLSERLAPKRRKRIAESKPKDIEAIKPDDPEFANKIITMHVAAPADTYFDGEQLLELFQARGYHFGEMDIFHSIHEGRIVFSIARMIEPGYFDIEDINSFATPGLTLILQLPGPVQADVAFEALWEEAYEIANELGGSVLDGDRNTLSKQTLQHMREGIYEYMHRQKYFGSVAS